MPIIITIDGPTASGKSSTAQLLAHTLGYYHLNSGFLFRSLAYLLMTKADYTTHTLYHPAQQDLQTYLAATKFVYTFTRSGNPEILFEGANITNFLKTPEIAQGASIVSTNGPVRSILAQIQRDLSKQYNLVADGRDCGSVIFPQAQVKFFLTAQLAVRAVRWQAGNKQLSLEQAEAELASRDHRDTTRPLDPLKVPEEAIFIDNGGMSLDETVAMMVGIVQDRL